MLFKLLGDNGKPVHSGSGAWPLPHDGQPGEWREESDIVICQRGLHLVSDPLAVWNDSVRAIYVAEPDLSKPIACNGSVKVACARARLVEEITTEWPLLGCFPRLRCALAATMRSADHDADISWANLAGANLARANLKGADLSRADLAWAKLSGADLLLANLSGANLSVADLSGANLASANLFGANLTGADLTRTNLFGANLTGADLSDAHLFGANLTGAYRVGNPPVGWIVESGRLQREA